MFTCRRGSKNWDFAGLRILSVAWHHEQAEPTCVRTIYCGSASTMRTILNFSYGSNLLSRRIVQRVPSARFVHAATLQGYVLQWHKVGQDGSGKCDIVKTSEPGACVFGVVYALAAGEKHRLDAAEGLGHGYDEKQVTLSVASGSTTAWTYCATAIDTSLRPYTWYKALVVAGAREHGLPSDYIDWLQQVPAVDDADAERARRHWAIAMPDARPMA